MKPSSDAREWLSRNVEFRTRSLSRGEALFRKDDATVGFYEVEQGRLRLLRHDQDGREIALHTAGAGELLAEASLFSDVYHCDAVAMTDARVRLYPKESCLAEFRRDPELALAFASRLARELMALRTRLELRNIRSARERIWNYLILKTGKDGRTIVLQGTVKDLAGELGLTHEALYRTLSRLEAEGEIARTTDKIVLKTTGV